MLLCPRLTPSQFEREMGGEKPFVIQLKELQIKGVVKDLRFLAG